MDKVMFKTPTEIENIVMGARDKCLKNPKYKLTEEEQFHIAVIAGVEVNFEPPDKFKDCYEKATEISMTTGMCGIHFDGEKFQVAILQGKK